MPDRSSPDSAGSIRFAGAYTALVTPFTEDASAVDLVRLRTLVERQADGGVRGIVPCGTTGESPTVRANEFEAIVGNAVEVGHARGLQVIPGCGSNDTRHAIENHRLAASLGADAALHVSPYYNKPSQEGLVRHFLAVADSADLPIVLYNIPGRCGVDLSPATIARIAEHPNVRALKQANGSIESVSDVLLRCSIDVLSGDDPMTLPMLSVGASGVVSVVSNLMPGEVQALCDAAAESRMDDARVLHARLFVLSRELMRLDVNPVPLKAALAELGLDTGAVRLPLAPLDEGARPTLRAALRAAGVFEAPADAGATEAAPA